MRNDGMKVLYRCPAVSSLRMGLIPKHQPLKPHSSDDPQSDPFDCMTLSPHKVAIQRYSSENKLKFIMTRYLLRK